MLCLLVLTQCWVAIQWVAGLTVDGGETFRYLLLGSGYSMLFFLLINLFDDRKKLTILLGTLVISGTFQAFFGALMTLSGTEWLLFAPKETARGVVTGTFINRNHLAGYLEMTIACGIGLMLAQRTRAPLDWRQLSSLVLSPKTFIRIALVIMVIALVMTRSRMGNTAFFSALALGSALFLLAHRQNRLRNALILASLIAVDLLIISQFFGLDNLRNRLMQTQLEDEVVAGEVVRKENVDRDDVAAYVMQMWKEKPIVGFGAGSFESAFPRYAGPDIPLDFDHAHNDFLQFATEFGAIGLSLIVFFVTLSLYHALRALFDRHSLYRSGVGLGTTIGITALLFHSFTDFNLQIPSNAATFIALCAVAVLNRSSPRRSSGSRASARAIL